MYLSVGANAEVLFVFLHVSTGNETSLVLGDGAGLIPLQLEFP